MVGDIEKEDLLVLQEFRKILCYTREHLKHGETMDNEGRMNSGKKEMWNNFIKSTWFTSKLIDQNNPYNEELAALSPDILIVLIARKILKYIFHEVESVIVSDVEYPVIDESSKIFTFYNMYFVYLIFF
jgi:hypothetical protein